MSIRILDIAEAMPDMHHTHAAGGGLHSVTEGLVRWDPVQKAVCSRHHVMNCVSPDRRLWRCLALSCGVGLVVEGYATPEGAEKSPSTAKKVPKRGKKLTEEDLFVFLDSLRCGLPLAKCAENAGRPVATFRARKKRDAGFRNRWDNARVTRHPRGTNARDDDL